MAILPLEEEVQLWSNAAERETYSSLAELYSILATLDGLEKAFIKDTITAEEYTPICQRLISQYKAVLQDDAVSAAYQDLDAFRHRYEVQTRPRPLQAPRAIERIRTGFPATVAAPSASQTSVAAPASNARLVAEATQNFITFLDALQIGLAAKDSLHPLLSDIISSVNAISSNDFAGRASIIQWLIILNQMKAAEDVTPDQVRQLKFDIQAAYDGFKETLV